MNDRTIARLIKALTPHVNAKLRGQPRTHGVNVHTSNAERRDIDIRAVGPGGITFFWWDGRDAPIPWSEIRRIETFEIGRRHGQQIRIRRRYSV